MIDVADRDCIAVEHRVDINEQVFRFRHIGRADPVVDLALLGDQRDAAAADRRFDCENNVAVLYSFR